jgi:putative PIN family toxin of toxin-antitoxin system
MLVLYDTNVLVTILSRREAILEFKNDVTMHRISHVTSRHILREVEAVLAERMKLTHQKAKAAARLLERQSTVVSPKTIEKICGDPFDDYVLATALEAKVEYLVSEDKDLLVLNEYKGMQIVTMSSLRNVVHK